jgi:tetratricopeptide (TPR) repeat protein
MSQHTPDDFEPGLTNPQPAPPRGPAEMDSLDRADTIRGLRAGERLFQRYALKRMLGRGGMGVVWLAWDEQLEEEVALKFLPDFLATDRLALDDLKRETRRSRKLSHPNIVRIHDFVQDDRCAGISMEFVDGDTLSNLRVEREDRTFTVEEMIPVMRQLCSALSHAHDEAKIVHRDLKPANLMVTSSGQLKVTDFGIASTLNQSSSMVTAPRMGGTLAYMSPQQLYGEHPSIADDIYALGATLYDLLTGKPPFFGGDVTLQIRDKTPAPLRERRAALGFDAGGIPPEWEQTVAACLAKKPADRPASVAVVAARLGLVDGEFTPVPDESLPQQAPPAPARGRGPLIATIVLLVLAMAGGAGWWWGIEQPRRQREAAALLDKQAAQQAEQKRIADENQKKQQDEEAAEKERLAKEKADAEELQKKTVERQRQTKMDDGLKTAQAALAGARFAEARSAFNEVLALDPANAVAKAGLASVDKAEMDAKTAAENKRQAAELVAAGQALQRAGKLDEAEAEARRALAAVSDFADARSLLAQIAAAKQQAAQHVAAGRALLKMGKLDEAAPEAHAALAIVTDFPDAKKLVSDIGDARSKIRKPTPTPKPNASQQQKTAESQKSPRLPVASSPRFATRVPGKSGYVMSPYDSQGRIIDVRGLPYGTEAECPYTHRNFLVP